MEEIRTFIAIELPLETKAVLSKVLGEIRFKSEKTVKWVNSESIHLTLKFLGNVPSSRISTIIESLERVAAGIEPCALEMEGLGAFPNLKLPRVVWVGVRGDILGVIRLQKQIDQEMMPLGFFAEKRPFSPHLTLGRVRDRATSRERADLGQLIESMELKKSPPFQVDHINLIKSTLTSSGALYEFLASIPLDSDSRK